MNSRAADEDGSYHPRIYMLYKESANAAAASQALAEVKSLRAKQTAGNLVPGAFPQN